MSIWTNVSTKARKQIENEKEKLKKNLLIPKKWRINFQSFIDKILFCRKIYVTYLTGLRLFFPPYSRLVAISMATAGYGRLSMYDFPYNSIAFQLVLNEATNKTKQMWCWEVATELLSLLLFPFFSFVPDTQCISSPAKKSFCYKLTTMFTYKYLGLCFRFIHPFF